MATLAQILRVRKQALRIVLNRMRAIDTAQEAIERFIKSLIARRNKLPSTSEMNKIISSMKLLDTLEGKLIQAAQTAIKVFEQSADLQTADFKFGPPSQRQLTQLGSGLTKFLKGITVTLPNPNLPEGTKG